MYIKTIILAKGMVEKYHEIRPKHRAAILKAFDIEIIENDKLPGNIAMLLNSDGRLVGIFNDGDLMPCPH